MLKSLTLSLPSWIDEYMEKTPQEFTTLEGRMKFVLGLAVENIHHKSGGPFSSAVFNIETGELISVGVNRVMPESCSCAHGEMMAIMLAQKRLGTYDFSLKGKFQLFTNAKMCIMCMGGVIWSGVCEVVSSATPEDVQNIIGFDEGPVPKEYNFELEKRGIKVIERVLYE